MAFNEKRYMASLPRRVTYDGNYRHSEKIPRIVDRYIGGVERLKFKVGDYVEMIRSDGTQFLVNFDKETAKINIKQVTCRQLVVHPNIVKVHI
jgi:hypothetical protein